MAMYAWHQLPAIDNLMNRYSDKLHASRQHADGARAGQRGQPEGRPRTLCEAYGAAGWDLRFEDMKRIGDWLYVLGVNCWTRTVGRHDSRGAEARSPASFSYHTPWWEGNHVSAEYFARLSAVLRRASRSTTSC